MVSRRASISTFGAMILVSTGMPEPALAADIPLPTGSYLQSCKVVSFDAATGDLAANCEGPAVGMFGLGTPDTSHMNVRGCREGTIWNDQRQLYCLSSEAWGNDRVIPPGSYIETCTDRKVVGGALLTAVCGNDQGASANASLDLRTCKWGGDIANWHGGLGCTHEGQGALSTQFKNAVAGGSQPDVVKPVAVEPGAVKPVTIAPLAPSEPAATADTPAEKRKKRRRDRGERG